MARRFVAARQARGLPATALTRYSSPPFKPTATYHGNLLPEISFLVASYLVPRESYETPSERNHDARTRQDRNWPREKWRRSRSSEFFYPFSSETGISRVGCRSKSVDSQVSVDLFFSFSINLLERGGESKRRRANGSLLKLSPIVPVPLINKPFFV